MKRQSVQSSNLSSVGFDENNNLLEIEFHNGSVYQYRGVSVSVHRNLMGSPSKGSYFSNSIKDRYSYIRLR